MNKQLSLLSNLKNTQRGSAHGGDLMKSREGRRNPRPLAVKNTMHLVLRSSKARGAWSFKKKNNELAIRNIIKRFSEKYGVKILSLANVGNHLHFQIKLSNRYTYNPFIRAISSAIVMAVTKASKKKPLKKVAKDRFWDYRPFTRIVQSLRALLNLKNYIQINQLEGKGYDRAEARWLIESGQLSGVG